MKIYFENMFRFSLPFFSFTGKIIPYVFLNNIIIIIIIPGLKLFEII
jgi:hypothetical protein